MATPLEHLEGKYEILEKMDDGGMGSVYKVRHRLLEEVRVIKVMRPHLAEDDVLRLRFVREAKVAIRLNHSGLAQVYDFTMDKGGYFFLVMEFIDGMDLHDVGKVVRPVPLGVVLEVAHQSLDVLGYLHNKDIVHRDISPDNLMITRDDDKKLRLKLIDLGIAKIQEDNEQLTATGAFLGKVRYSSPEHFQTSEGYEVSPRSDIYSLGIVLFELLTGEHPVQGSNISAQIAGHLMHKFQTFDTCDTGNRVPEEVRAIVEKATAREQQDRYADAAEFQDAVDSVRAKYPVEAEDLTKIFDVPSLPTMKIKVKKPGSTQAHLNRNFGVDATPAHGEVTAVQSAPPPIEKAKKAARADKTTQAVKVGKVKPDDVTVTRKKKLETQKLKVEKPPPDSSRQTRALLLGAEKLIEAEAFEEARLQLEAVDALDPSNPEAAKIRKTLNTADTKRQDQLKEAIATVEALIEGEQTDDARSELAKAVEQFGSGARFDRLASRIDDTAAAVAARADQVANILGTARRLVAEDRWEDAVPMVREAMILDPNHDEATDLLEIVEAGLVHWRENERRRKEIETAASAINDHLAKEDIDEARRALALARKVYGKEDAFGGFDTAIEELEKTLVLRTAETLREKGRAAMEAGDFKVAIDTLNESLKMNPDDTTAADLVAGAREGLRLQAEAAKRQKSIDKAALGIDRLIQAGRFETAFTTIDETVSEYGDFDAAAELKQQIEHEIEARSKAEAKIVAQLQQARNMIAKLDFDAAEKKIETARAPAEEFPELLDLIDEAVILLEDGVTAHRRARDVAKAAAGIEKQLNAGALDAAVRELEVAQRIFGDEGVFVDLGDRIAKQQQEQRIAEIEAMARDALGKKKHLAKVLAEIEEALALNPDDDRLQRLLAETRGTRSRLEKEKRGKAIAAVLVDVDKLIAKGKFEEALVEVERAAGDLGDFKEARSLRLRLKRALAE